MQFVTTRPRQHINEGVSKTVSNGFYGFRLNRKQTKFLRLNGDNRIVSSVTFTTKFTFFFVISADESSSGRLRASHEGYIVFGYWGSRLGTFWIERSIALQGYDTNEGSIQFLFCRNDNDVKTA